MARVLSDAIPTPEKGEGKGMKRGAQMEKQMKHSFAKITERMEGQATKCLRISSKQARIGADCVSDQGQSRTVFCVPVEQGDWLHDNSFLLFCVSVLVTFFLFTFSAFGRLCRRMKVSFHDSILPIVVLWFLHVMEDLFQKEGDRHKLGFMVVERKSLERNMVGATALGGKRRGPKQIEELFRILTLEERTHRSRPPSLVSHTRRKKKK